MTTRTMTETKNIQMRKNGGTNIMTINDLNKNGEEEFDDVMENLINMTQEMLYSRNMLYEEKYELECEVEELKKYKDDYEKKNNELERENEMLKNRINDRDSRIVNKNEKCKILLQEYSKGLSDERKMEIKKRIQMNYKRN